MAKAKASDTSVAPAASDRKWEIEDALRTLTRAYEIIGDKTLMAGVKKLAAERAEEMTAIAGKADGLAKMGLISDKARTKMDRA